jgi:Fe-S-cluster-containing hydrogenase component 2
MPAVYVIAEQCIDVKDKSCVEVCPVDCIHTDDELDRMCYIDPQECIGCNLCLPACPVGAIFTEDDVPKGSQAFVEINRLWFQDAATARAKVETLAL